MTEPPEVGYVEVRAYAELNDFLAPELRGATVRRPFRSHQTVKDVLEAMGIPHTEIDLILLNGDPVDFDHRPTAGDRIAAYPMFEALDVASTARLRPVPLRDPRFVVDVNLGRLARLLRVLGFDAWWSSDADDAALARISLDEQRILLTRDRGLLKRRAITHGLFVHSQDPEQQALEVMRRLDLRERLAPLTRCLHCNGALQAVDKRDVIDQLEPLTAQYYEEFSRCAGCGRIYWAGSHHAKLLGLVERLRGQL
ncbi:hypothetical protein A5747_11695 [Mycobacterium sp. IS-836]|uniref:Mut7-C RNAse domain-containing protein n=1 Tax=Mycobacterium sp. IS-836 TaxID=1834160 RepID=UPI00096E737D|nr:Mut7-C RNAse domain-containing protein [Mycobacterium sp. IS-836]OMC55781.1 hypothetical protein A5747_11695 [Mycobacterium sp. IS-836]